jgi:predicted LPLAT superfamily acyltransferase
MKLGFLATPWLHTRSFFGRLLRLPRLLTRRSGSGGGTWRKAWYAQQERGSLLGIRITVWFYRRIGRGIARLLLYPIVAYFFLTDSASRRASLNYLRRLCASPEGARAVGAEPSARHVWRHFFEFSVTILDRIGFWLGLRSDFELTIQGMEHLQHIVDENRGGLVLGSHLGSFDAMRLVAAAESPIFVHVLMFTQHAARINEIFRQLGQLSSDRDVKVRIIQVEPGSFQHVLDVKACIERGEVVAILADRVHPNEAERVSRVEFLGGRAALPQGPMLLASLLACPVVLMTGVRTGDRRYQICVEPFADRIQIARSKRRELLAEYCQRYADRLAAHCLRTPYQWFNFYDFWGQEESGVDA